MTTDRVFALALAGVYLTVIATKWDRLDASMIVLFGAGAAVTTYVALTQ